MAKREPLGIPTASRFGLLVRCPASFYGPQPKRRDGKPGIAAEVGTKVHSIMAKCVSAKDGRLDFDRRQAYEMAVSLGVLPDWEQMKPDECISKLNDWLDDRGSFGLYAHREVAGYAREEMNAHGGVYYHPTFLEEHADAIYDSIRKANHGYLYAGTADLVLTDGHSGSLLLLDWKTGSQEVEARGNFQLRALNTFWACKSYGIADLNTGEVDIHEASHYELDVDREAFKYIVGDKKKAETWENAGPHCLRCDRKHVCSTFARHNGGILDEFSK